MTHIDLSSFIKDPQQEKEEVARKAVKEYAEFLWKCGHPQYGLPKEVDALLCKVDLGEISLREFNKRLRNMLDEKYRIAKEAVDGQSDYRRQP